MKISKNIVIAAGSFLLAAGLMFGILNGIHKRKLENIENSYKAQIEEINLEKAAAQAHSDSIDFILAQQEATIDSLDKVGDKYKWEIEHLKEELIDAWNTIFDADIDENYEWLQARYPSDDSLNYGFAGEQVKGIALDLIRGDYKDSIIGKMQLKELNLRAQLLTSSEMIATLYKERDEWEFLRTSLYDRLAAKTEELNMSDQEVEELKKKLRVTYGTGGGILAGLIVLALLL